MGLVGHHIVVFFHIQCDTIPLCDFGLKKIQTFLNPRVCCHDRNIVEVGHYCADVSFARPWFCDDSMELLKDWVESRGEKQWAQWVSLLDLQEVGYL